MPKFLNKVIVITGASRGLGKSLKEYLEKDNTVVSIARSLEEDGILSFRADVGNKAEVERVFEAIGSRYGHIDVLVNNAGYGLSGATEYISEAEARAIFDTNFFGVLWCSQCALKYMERGAKIVTIGSAGAMIPMPFRAMYNASKAAVHSLSYSLNMELEPLGIEAGLVIMGAINTQFANNRHRIKASNGRYEEAASACDEFVDGHQTTGKMSLSIATKEIVNYMQRVHMSESFTVGLPYRILSPVARTFPVLTTKVNYLVMNSPRIFKRKKS